MSRIDRILIYFTCVLKKASLGCSYICNTRISRYFSATFKQVFQTVEDITHKFEVAVAIYMSVYIYIYITE